MKKLLLPSLLVLLGLVAFAGAQTVNRSIQLSQDPTGPVGYDAVQGGTYFPGHINSATRVGPPPSVGTCGTTPSVVGSDNAGKITTGSSATTACTLTFGTVFAVAPACMLSTTVTNAGPLFIATTTTTAVLNYASATSAVISYICIGQS